MVVYIASCLSVRLRFRVPNTSALLAAELLLVKDKFQGPGTDLWEPCDCGGYRSGAQVGRALEVNSQELLVLLRPSCGPHAWARFFLEY